MIFGYQQTGGAGGPQLWQLNGGAPNSISVKTPTVNGIDSPNFVNTLISFFSGQILSVVNFVGSVWRSGTEALATGIFDDSGSIYAAHLYENQATGELIANGIDLSNKTIVSINENGVNLYTERNQSITGIGSVVEDNTGAGNGVITAHNSTSEITEIKQAGNVVLAYGADAAGLIVTDGVNQRFRITPAGNIQTDQCVPALPHLFLFAEMPVYNMAGVLQGYVKLYT